MRILVLSHEYPPLGGGAGKCLKECAQELVRAGHAVDVVTMAYGDLDRQEESKGVRVHRVRCLRKKAETCETYEMATYVASAVACASRLARRERYDACWTHCLVPAGLAALAVSKIAGLPYVVTSHGSDVPGYNEDRFTREHSVAGPLLRLVARHASTLTSPSSFLKSLIQKNIRPSTEVRVISNGIDLGTYKERPKKDIILATGRLLERKGFQHLIAAVKDLETDYEVHIAGDGPYRSELERQASGSKTKVVFRGWLDKDSDELRRLYEEAMIFVLPSKMENASISLLEAMAARTAVITTNVSGCPETVGDAGILVDPESPQQIRYALLRLMRDPLLVDVLSQKGRDRAEERFDWPGIARQYEALFQRAST